MLSNRRTLICLSLIASCLSSGCATSWFRPNTATQVESKRDKIRKRLESENRPKSVIEIGGARQLSYGSLENIALVSHLPGTGGKVDPSPQRERMLDTMRRHDVRDTNSYLDSNETAMVAVVAAIPPAVRKGDRLNVAVKLSAHAQATDLAQGWLRETSLVETGVLGGRVRESFDRAKAEGSLVTLAQYTGSQDPQAKLEAVVVGGARLLKERDLGIGLSPEFADALTMAAVVPAINHRFTHFDGTKQTGIATPISDDYIEIKIPPRYSLDPYHLMNVVLRIRFNESESQQAQRIQALTQQIQEAATVRQACWELEALGESSKDILASQINSPDPTIQFCCARSLAYLADERAAAVLAELAISQPELREGCLNALASLDSYRSDEALRSLINQDNPEVRYGAVRALRHRNPRDPLISSPQTFRVGSLLEIPTSGPDMVAISLTSIPEVVFFGRVPQVKLSAFHNVNPNLLLKSSGPNQITVSHFAADQEDRIVECDSDLRSVLEAIAKVGGGYGDWVRLVRESQEMGMISIPVAMNPVPGADLQETGNQQDGAQGEEATSETSSGLPDQDNTIIPDADTPWYKPRFRWPAVNSEQS